MNIHMVCPTGFCNHERFPTLTNRRLHRTATPILTEHAVHAKITPPVSTSQHELNLTGHWKDVLFPRPDGAVVVGGEANPVYIIVSGVVGGVRVVVGC